MTIHPQAVMIPSRITMIQPRNQDDPGWDHDDAESATTMAKNTSNIIMLQAARRRRYYSEEEKRVVSLRRDDRGVMVVR
jgi:hypothetical protein